MLPLSLVVARREHFPRASLGQGRPQGHHTTQQVVILSFFQLDIDTGPAQGGSQLGGDRVWDGVPVRVYRQACVGGSESMGLGFRVRGLGFRV